jgi:hypothetical protein
MRHRRVTLVATAGLLLVGLGVPLPAHATAGDRWDASGTMAPGLLVIPTYQSITFRAVVTPLAGPTSVCDGSGFSNGPIETVAAGQGSGTWRCTSGPLTGLTGAFTYARAAAHMDISLSGGATGVLTCVVSLPIGPFTCTGVDP